MPLPNNQWEDALRDLQPGAGGGVMPSGRAGNMGNIPYAPGAMRGIGGGLKPPGAGDLYRSLNPGLGGGAMGGYRPSVSPSSPGGYQPYPGASRNPALAQPMGGAPGYQANYGAAQARGLTDALRRMILARGGVAATRGGRGLARPLAASPLTRY